MGCLKDAACDFYIQDSDSCNCGDCKPCESIKVEEVKEKKSKKDQVE
jgi:hypothetical protein